VEPETLLPPKYMEAQHFTLHLPARESCLSCPSSGIPALNWVAICYSTVVKRLAPYSAQRHRTPPMRLQENSCVPIKELELQPPNWREKRGNQHHKNSARGNISSISISESTTEAPGEKNSKPQLGGAQRIKTLTKNNFKCININAEWNSKTTTLQQKQFHH
jgi:hypothetical protein